MLAPDAHRMFLLDGAHSQITGQGRFQPVSGSGQSSVLLVNSADGMLAVKYQMKNSKYSILILRVTLLPGFAYHPDVSMNHFFSEGSREISDRL